MKFLTITYLIISLIASTANADHRASIGSGLVINDLQIKGSELKVIPRIHSKIPIILRIIEAKSKDDGYNYDLHVEGLDEGQYNLAHYLTRADGSETTIPEIKFEAYTILQDKWTEPRPLAVVKPDKIGGYKKLIWVLGILWAIGLIAILLIRKKRSAEEPQLTEPSLSDRIYKLLNDSNNDLTSTQKAELDRMIIGHWLHQFPDLNIEHRSVADSIAFLKTQKESAPMLLSIEKWLHSGKEISAKEIQLTLSSYKSLKKEETN